jgi:hypothetical protein
MPALTSVAQPKHFELTSVPCLCISTATIDKLGWCIRGILSKHNISRLYSTIQLVFAYSNEPRNDKHTPVPPGRDGRQLQTYTTRLHSVVQSSLQRLNEPVWFPQDERLSWYISSISTMFLNT